MLTKLAQELDTSTCSKSHQSANPACDVLQETCELTYVLMQKYIGRGGAS